MNLLSVVFVKIIIYYIGQLITIKQWNYYCDFNYLIFLLLLLLFNFKIELLLESTSTTGKIFHMKHTRYLSLKMKYFSLLVFSYIRVKQNKKSSKLSNRRCKSEHVFQTSSNLYSFPNDEYYVY